MELLPDPYKDRQAKCERPPNKPLADSVLYPLKGSDKDKPDWKVLRDFLLKEGPLKKEQVVKIVKDGINMLSKESNMVKIGEPIVIVGDLHGQYYDLVHMLEKAGDPSEINYLFLGDYVDRGIFGIEVVLVLLAIKMTYPRNVVMLRGNHESRNMTENFTFREEVISRFDIETYNLFMDLFDSMPISCIVDGKYFAMHGGISPQLTKLDQIEKINRFQEVPLDGLFCDLLWSDPLSDDLASSKEYIDNEERECSYLFGKKPTKKLLDQNNLMSILRGHQVQIEGYKMHRWDGPASFPYVITIFSAPNYCGYYENKASVLIIDKGNLSLKQYDESETPYRLPDNLDVFSWSMPFLAEKVVSMLYTIVKRGDTDGDDDDESPFEMMKQGAAQEEEGKQKRGIVMKNKIKSVGRLSKMFSTLRQESETLLRLKNMSPDGKLPRGLLLEGKPAIRNALKQFNLAKDLDKVNEKRPKKK